MRAPLLADVIRRSSSLGRAGAAVPRTSVKMRVGADPRASVSTTVIVSPFAPDSGDGEFQSCRKVARLSRIGDISRP